MMESSKKQKLLEKYWEGLSTPEEESFLLKDDHADKLDQSYFDLVQEFKSIKLSDGFDERMLQALPSARKRTINARLLRIAAAIAVVVGVGLTYVRQHYPVIGSDGLTAHERQQLELTKEALLLMSAKMNEGLNYTYALGEFDEAINTFTEN